jgi:hypothetical protein
MGAFATLRGLLTGGVAVSLPADPTAPDGPVLIHTVIQVDGDIVNRVSPALLAKPATMMTADIDRHRQAVIAALKPLKTVKTWIARFGVAVGTVGAGTALGSGFTAVSTQSDVAEPLLTTGGGAVAVIAVIVGRIPAVSGFFVRSAVSTGIRFGRSWLGRRLSGA